VSPAPPLTLATSTLPVRAVALLAARASLGGPRETLLGVLQAARMVDGAVGPQALPGSLRRSRASAARAWLASLSIPAAVRSTLARAIDATAADDRPELAAAWNDVVQFATPSLDHPARNELRRISARLAADA
jgi:hypothetical protein